MSYIDLLLLCCQSYSALWGHFDIQFCRLGLFSEMEMGVIVTVCRIARSLRFWFPES